MKLELEREKCIGCGACIATANKYFDFDDEGMAVVIKAEVEEGDGSAVDAVETCPTDAIKLIK